MFPFSNTLLFFCLFLCNNYILVKDKIQFIIFAFIPENKYSTWSKLFTLLKIFSQIICIFLLNGILIILLELLGLVSPAIMMLDEEGRICRSLVCISPVKLLMDILNLEIKEDNCYEF